MTDGMCRAHFVERPIVALSKADKMSVTPSSSCATNMLVGDAAESIHLRAMGAGKNDYRVIVWQKHLRPAGGNDSKTEYML
jgi:hypothetical protein